MSNIINQQEDTQITDLNSNESIDISNITSDEEKLDEMMKIFFKEDEDESISISIGKSGYSSKIYTVKSRPESTFSNQSSIRKVIFDRQGKKKISSKRSENFQSFDESNISFKIRKLSEGELHSLQFIQQLEFQEILQLQESQNDQSKCFKNYGNQRQNANISMSIKSEKNAQFSNNVSEPFNESRAASNLIGGISFTNDRINKMVESNFQPATTTNSFDTGDWFFKDNILTYKKKYNIQNQFGELPREQAYVCGCIEQNENESIEEQKDICNIL